MFLNSTLYFQSAAFQAHGLLFPHLYKALPDNRYTNLARATIPEAWAHAQGSPLVKRARKSARENGTGGNTKLTIEKVKAIKALLAKGKTLKELALQYGVSDMQIHRIRTGENRAGVK